MAYVKKYERSCKNQDDLLKVHFKRQGMANLLVLQGLPEECNVHIELDYFKGSYYVLIMKKYEGSMCVDSKAVRWPNDFDYKQIEAEIRTYIENDALVLEMFIESYFIGQKGHLDDKDFVDGVDVTGMTVADVIKAARINLEEFFNDWRVGSKVAQVLSLPSDNILDMSFRELYSLIHWNHYKSDFESIFFKSIKK